MTNQQSTWALAVGPLMALIGIVLSVLDANTAARLGEGLMVMGGLIALFGVAGKLGWLGDDSRPPVS